MPPEFYHILERLTVNPGQREALAQRASIASRIQPSVSRSRLPTHDGQLSSTRTSNSVSAASYFPATRAVSAGNVGQPLPSRSRNFGVDAQPDYIKTSTSASARTAAPNSRYLPSQGQRLAARSAQHAGEYSDEDIEEEESEDDDEESEGDDEDHLKAQQRRSHVSASTTGQSTKPSSHNVQQRGSHTSASTTGQSSRPSSHSTNARTIDHSAEMLYGRPAGPSVQVSYPGPSGYAASPPSSASTSAMLSRKQQQMLRQVLARYDRS